MIAAIIVTTALIIFFTTYLVMLTKKTNMDKAFKGIGKLMNKKNRILQQIISQLRNAETRIDKSELEETSVLVMQAQSRKLKTEEKINLGQSIHRTINPIIKSVNHKSLVKKDPNLERLILSLQQTDSKISVAMESFNKKASDFNNVIGIFPANIIASARRNAYKRRELLETMAD